MRTRYTRNERNQRADRLAWMQNASLLVFMAFVGIALGASAAPALTGFNADTAFDVFVTASALGLTAAIFSIATGLASILVREGVR